MSVLPLRPLYTPVLVEFLGGRWVRVLEPITWRGPFPATVAADTVSDGGTIPAIAWPVIGHPFSASVLVCYLLHDVELSAGVPWPEATARLDARLRALAIAPARRWAIVLAVRLRGWWRRL